MLLFNKRWTIKNLKQRLGVDSVHLQGFESYGYRLNSEWVKRDGVRCKEYWLSYIGK